MKKYTTREIESIMSDRIRNKVYETDEKLPAERVLEEEFGVSRTTIRNVLSSLINRRLAYRIPDVGVFPEKEIIRRSNEIIGFNDLIKRSGREAKTEIVKLKLTSPDPFVTKKMKLKATDKVYILERKRFVNGNPFLYEYIYINASLTPNLEKYDLSIRSLYDVYLKEYGITLHFINQGVSASTVNGIVSDFLYGTSTAYSLLVEGLTHCQSGEIIEFGIGYYHSENFSYDSILINDVI